VGAHQQLVAAQRLQVAADGGARDAECHSQGRDVHAAVQADLIEDRAQAL
jgi:hypothetical protein